MQKISKDRKKILAFFLAKYIIKKKGRKWGRIMAEEKKKKGSANWIYGIIAVFMVGELAYGGVLLYGKYGSKFQDATVEIGTREEISAKDFLKNEKYAEEAEIVTDWKKIDFGKVGEYAITLRHQEKEETVQLNLVDTTPPEVTFQDIVRYKDYEINADDFIVEKSDLSEMTVEVANVPEITGFANYPVMVVVKDASGNETKKECNLQIEWLKREFTMEKGDGLSKEDLLYNAEEDGELLDDDELKRIASSDIGDYELKVEHEGNEYTVKIKITDLTPPSLKLRDVTIYDDETIEGKDAFIVSAKDASGEVTTKMKTEINYKKLGAQKIVIEAVDKYGNVSEETATLTIRKDTVGPVISGLSAMTVTKGASIDYRKGVSAKDAKDGACEFEVNTDNVNMGKAGTYYATYTSSDTKGNKTTSKRKITIKHNAEDERALVKEIASGLSSNVEEIRDYCRNKIRYSHSYGDGEPIWYGFNNWNGNCYVHAMCFQALLKEKGYATQLIWVTNKSHYWNLVKIGGVWRHMDATPDSNHRKISIMTDEERLSTLKGRDWDHSAWPAAN